MTIHDLVQRELGADYGIKDNGRKAVIVFYSTDGREIEVWRLPAHSSLIGVEWLRDFLQQKKRPFNFRKEMAALRYARRRALESAQDELVRLAEKEVRRL